MGDFLGDVLRGYTNEQLSEAMLFTLVNYLKEKNLIDIDDFSTFYTDNVSKVLELVVERDRNNKKEVSS